MHERGALMERNSPDLLFRMEKVKFFNMKFLIAALRKNFSI